MSGSTVQRGEFSILRKSARARMALEHGADLVICLPTPWSCARAQDFCRAAVQIIKALGCIDLLSFGSECGDINILKKAAAGLRDEGVLRELKRRVGEGAAFATARQEALAQMDFAASQCLRKPNDTLNVEYITALKGMEIEFLAVPRRGGLSASELRIIIETVESNGKYLQKCYNPSAYKILSDELSSGYLVDNRSLETALLARLRTMRVAELARLPDVSEGMEHLLFRAVRQGRSMREVLSNAVGKRYPAARLRRIMFHALLGVKADDFIALPCYIQVMGFNEAGCEILRRMKTSAALPIIHRHADMQKLDGQGIWLYETECRATNLQALAMRNVLPCGTEERRKIVII